MYIGSFWDEPWQHTGMQELMESDEVGMLQSLTLTLALTTHLSPFTLALTLTLTLTLTLRSP